MTDSSTIKLNGQPHPVAGTQSITSLLAELGLAGKPVVVELNEEAVFPRDYDRTQVDPGARVEIVALAAGG